MMTCGVVWRVVIRNSQEGVFRQKMAQMEPYASVNYDNKDKCRPDIGIQSITGHSLGLAWKRCKPKIGIQSITGHS